MNTKNNRGCLSAILGTLIVILAVGAYAVLSSLISNAVISTRFGNDAACALLSLSFTAISVSFVLYEAIFIVWEIKTSKSGDADAARLKKIFRIVCVACICLSLMLAVFSANTFTRLDGDSVSKVCFVEYKTYTWEDRNDVLSYSLSCDPTGKLSYIVTMKDGETVELFSSVNSCSDGFIEKYENLYGYAAHITQKFKNSEFIIEGKISGIEYMEKFYKDDRPEIWKHLDIIIGNEVE